MHHFLSGRFCSSRRYPRPPALGTSTALQSSDKLLLVAIDQRPAHRLHACVIMQMHRPRDRSSSTALVLVLLTAAIARVQQASAAAAAEAPPVLIGLPGCPTRCGNVSVPYPFGIRTGCSLPGFDLTCDRAHRPPRLLLLGAAGTASILQVTAISLDDATISVRSSAMVNHTSNSTPEARGMWGFLGGGNGPFFLPYRRNELVVTGCNVQGTLHGNGTSLIAGCSTFCPVDSKDDAAVAALGGACNACTGGNGCCRAAIPLFYPSYGSRLKRLDPNPTRPAAERLQNLVFIAEQGWIEGVWCQAMSASFPEANGGSVPPQPDLSAAPVVLEWAMDSALPAHHGYVDDASRCPTDGASGACKSRHSTCIDLNSPFRSGYACRCSPGYHGNPYLVGGCQGECLSNSICPVETMWCLLFFFFFFKNVLLYSLRFGKWSRFGQILS